MAVANLALRRTSHLVRRTVVSMGGKLFERGGGRRPNRSHRRQSGASLVEFALLAPLLFAILLGTITTGLALSKKNSMTNAVREGGRLGATLPEGTGWTADWAVDVKDRIIALAGNDLDESEVCVRIIDVTPVSPAPDVVKGSFMGTACPVSQEPATPSSTSKGCIVKVWARTSADINAVFFTRSLTLDATALGIYERSGECP